MLPPEYRPYHQQTAGTQRTLSNRTMHFLMTILPAARETSTFHGPSQITITISNLLSFPTHTWETFKAYTKRLNMGRHQEQRMLFLYLLAVLTTAAASISPHTEVR